MSMRDLQRNVKEGTEAMAAKFYRHGSPEMYCDLCKRGLQKPFFVHDLAIYLDSAESDGACPMGQTPWQRIVDF